MKLHVKIILLLAIHMVFGQIVFLATLHITVGIRLLQPLVLLYTVLPSQATPGVRRANVTTQSFVISKDDPAHYLNTRNTSYYYHRYYKGDLPSSHYPDGVNPYKNLNRWGSRPKSKVPSRPKQTKATPGSKIRSQPYHMPHPDSTAYTEQLDLREEAYNPNHSALNEPMLSIERPRREVKEDDPPYVIDELTTNAIKADVVRHYFIAFDCRKPKNIRATSSLLRNECANAPVDTVTSGPSSRYQIIQRLRRKELTGTKCRRTFSQSTSYCGNADHSTPIPHLTYYNREVIMTKAECKEMADSHLYTDPTGKVHKISPNTELVVSYYVLGTTYVSDDGITANQISCNGGQMIISGKPVDQIVQYREDRVLFKTETIVEREDQSLVAYFDNLRLPCSVNDGFCRAGRNTYVWDKPKSDYCDLAVAKEFTGFQTTSSSLPDKIIMSNDKSLVRFIVRGSTTGCGRQLILTNYPNLFLFEIQNADGTIRLDTFKEKLPAREVNLNVFISNRDDTLYYKLKGELSAEYRDVWRDDCFSRFRDEKLHHWVQRMEPEYHTYSVGGDSFLIPAGEVVYQYQCEARLVVAQPVTECFNALPVEFAHRVKGANYTRPSKPEWYLEPLTHRLSKVATNIKCTPSFFHRYQDVLGRWIAQTPDYKMVANPQEIVVNSRRNKTRVDTETPPDFSQGGIYTSEDMDAFQAHLEFSRVRDAVINKLANQAADVDPDGAITPNVLFHDSSLPTGSWSTFILGKIWGWFRSLGEVASVFIASVMVTRALWFIFKSVMNFYHLYMVHGLSPELLFACCADVLFLRHYFRNGRQQRPPNNPPENHPLILHQPQRADTDPTSRPNTRTSIFGFGRRRNPKPEEDSVPLNNLGVNRIPGEPPRPSAPDGRVYGYTPPPSYQSPAQTPTRDIQPSHAGPSTRHSNPNLHSSALQHGPDTRRQPSVYDQTLSQLRQIATDGFSHSPSGPSGQSGNNGGSF